MHALPRLLSTALLTVCVGSQAASYSALAVFGDSLSDSGNNAALLGSGGGIPTSNSYVPGGAPYASGTYSNGPVWVSSFAASLGLPSGAEAALTGGTNYAFGGARTNDAAIVPPSATTQVTSFLSGVSTLPATGLYVIAIGGNDVRDVAQSVALGASPTTIATAATAYATSVGNMVDALQAKGAKNIVVWDAPNVGATPAALSINASFASLATNVASAFNLALAGRLAGEAGVIGFDIFGIVNTIVANPGAYGLTNVTDACGAVVNSCSASLSTALFYDGIHPTAKGHQLLAAAMLNAVTAVPEPSTVLLLAFGVAAVLALARRQVAAR